MTVSFHEYNKAFHLSKNFISNIKQIILNTNKNNYVNHVMVSKSPGINMLLTRNVPFQYVQKKTADKKKKKNRLKQVAQMQR